MTSIRSIFAQYYEMDLEPLVLDSARVGESKCVGESSRIYLPRWRRERRRVTSASAESRRRRRRRGRGRGRGRRGVETERNRKKGRKGKKSFYLFLSFFLSFVSPRDAREVRTRFPEQPTRVRDCMQPGNVVLTFLLLSLSSSCFCFCLCFSAI